MNIIGQRINILRSRAGISVETLALRSGISSACIEQIENGKTNKIDNRELLAIADNLDLANAHDFAWLMKENSINRSFQAYTVGLPKTGTFSLCSIFNNYRSFHELYMWETNHMIAKYKNKEASREEMASFLIKRDLKGDLPEMDSAYFNYHYMDRLAEEFPDARFICLVRDCYSWVESFIEHFTAPERESIHTELLYSGLPFDLPKGESEAKKELIRNLQKYIDHPLGHWSGVYKEIKRKLPPGRSIIIKTNEISGSLPRLAEFVGVTPDTLIAENTHMNSRAEKKIKLSQMLGKDFLKEKMDEHGREMMEELFPELDFDNYLEEKMLN